MESDRRTEVATGKELVPLPIPVLELLESLPLVFIVADQLRSSHDAIPVVFDADVGDPHFFEMIQDLDRRGLTSLMILMPVF